MKEKVRFPWRVGVAGRFGCTPAISIVDPDGRIVARMMSGTEVDAERIVRSANRWAETTGTEEV